MAKDDRLLVPVDKDYLHALGEAAYAFARLEWAAVHCCEKLKPGCINQVADLVAGTIATTLIKQAKTTAQTPDALELRAAADTFQTLTKKRNGLIHAQPGSDSDEAQRLFRNGTPWTVAAMNDAADEFTECSSRLNALLHGFLA